jgi:hypothetical protein
MGTLIHGLFAHHDRERFEVFAYGLADRHDAYTASVQAGVDQYTVVFGWSHRQIAERIRGDRIDVLIDLMGHIAAAVGSGLSRNHGRQLDRWPDRRPVVDSTGAGARLQRTGAAAALGVRELAATGGHLVAPAGPRRAGPAGARGGVRLLQPGREA